MSKVSTIMCCIDFIVNNASFSHAEVTNQSFIVEALLNTSFMAPIHGKGNSLQVGSANENLVLNNLHQFLAKHSATLHGKQKRHKNLS